MDALAFNELAYASHGFDAQRRYPNEELLRFMGRNFFPLPHGERAGVKILEAGCGSGANLWMLAREGFDAHGIDISPSAVELCRAMLDHWKVTAGVKAGDMTALPHADGTFDAVLDVFSAYSLTEAQFDCFASETARVLKPGGKFFSYTPSKTSDCFKRRSAMIDASTLDGLGSPYPCNHPFRFVDASEYRDILAAHGLSVTYSEIVGRTYGVERFEWVVVEASKSHT